MPYSKQTWVDGDTTKPLSAARMGVLEQGVFTAQGAAETAQTTAAAAASAASSAQTTANNAATAAALTALAARTSTLETQVAGLNTTVGTLSGRVSALESPATAPSTTAPIPVGTLAGWSSPVFAEDFTRVAAVGSFESVYGSDVKGYTDGTPDSNGKNNGTQTFYWPSKVLSAIPYGAAGHPSDCNGVMRYDLHSEVISGVRKWLAATPTPGPSQLGGRWDFRLYIPAAVTGFKLAWLLWPTDEVWEHGELDFLEGSVGNTMRINHHQMDVNPGATPYTIDTLQNFSTPHTFTVEWIPGVSVRYYLDGVRLLTATLSVPTVAHDLRMQVETEISGTTPSDTAQGYVYVDWVVQRAIVSGYDYSTTVARTFVGSNGAAPAAPVSVVSGTNTIQTNRLQQVTAASAYSTAVALLGQDVTDCVITATLLAPAATVDMGVLFRYNTTTGTRYGVFISNGSLVVRKWNGSNITQLAIYTLPTVTPGATWKIKLSSGAGGFSAKAWTGATEPAWQIVPDFTSGNSIDYSYIRGDVALQTQTTTSAAGTGQWVDVTTVIQ